MALPEHVGDLHDGPCGVLQGNFVGLITHIEEWGSLQFDPPPPGRLKFAQICKVVARMGPPWCVTQLARHALKHSIPQL